MLLLPSCFGLGQLVNICKHFGNHWDIKFNPLKSQLMTFDGSNPIMAISMNSLSITTLGEQGEVLGSTFLV